MVMLHIKIKDNHECSNVVANILPAAPPPHTHTHLHPHLQSPTLWMESVGKKIIFFSVHGHITYQIKENHKCCNILPADTLDPMVG